MNDQSHPALRDVPIGIDAAGTRRETDSMGEHRRAGRPLLGRPDAAQPHPLLDRRRPHAEARLPRLRLRQEGGGAGQRGRRAAAAVEGRGHRARRRRGDRRQARRALPALRLADRLGHAVEHERQRGAVEPRDPAARRRRSAASRRCTRTTTSTWASRRTTPSRPRCTSPPCSSSRNTCCRGARRWLPRSRPRRANGTTSSRSGGRISRTRCR